jgi:polysaccharide biosynthesis transport protein
MSGSPPSQPDSPLALPAVQASAPRGSWGGQNVAPPAPEEPAFDLRRSLAVLARYKWLIVALTALGTTAGFVAGRLVPPVFAAQATLWLQIGDVRGARPTGPIQAAGLLEWSSWVDLLRSFVVLDEVVRREHVYIERSDAGDSTLFAGFVLKRNFVPGEYRLEISRDARSFVLLLGGREVQRGTVGDSVGSAYGFGWVPASGDLRPGLVVRFRVWTPRDAALRLKDKLVTKLPQQGSFLQLELEGRDASATASTLNAIADRFVEVAAELKRQKLTELSQILREQLNSSYADLRRAEGSLETFRVRTITLPSEQSSPVAPGLEQTTNPAFQAFFNMRVQRDQLERDRQAIDRVLAQPDSFVTAVQLEAIPSVREGAELRRALSELTDKEASARAMRLQFTDQHPPLQRLQGEIDALRRQSVPGLARQLSAELAARVRESDTRIGSASHELQQIPMRAIEEARLRRDVAIAENLYTTLQQRYEEARLAEVSSIPDVRILDRAVAPDQPLKNRVIIILLGGLLGGLGSAAGLAILLDQHDRRVRYPEQVSLGMGLAILGALPRLRGGKRRIDGETEGQVVEALRAIRMNLAHAYGAAGPLVTTITSPGSGDGKSFLASNLAISFADAGHRVLLIDADIRRGGLHRVLGLQRKPGLLDFLGGSTIIILDSAPLGAGVDPLILGALTGSIVLVLRTGVSDREFTIAKLDAVSRLPIRVLGAVLNDVKPTDGYGYYAYLPGYGTSEEKGEGREAIPKRLAGPK